MPPKPADKKYFLVSHVYVRIYPNDLAELSREDFRTWLLYMRYAGSEHIYVYDCYHTPDEQLRDFLQPAIDAGFVTYEDWSHVEVRQG